MSVSFSGPCLPPSSSLPPVRRLITATETQISAAIKNLQALYCPLRIPNNLPKYNLKRAHIPVASTPVPVDSGYASEREDEDSETAAEEVTAALRADPFEQKFATRWLTSLIARIEETNFDDQVTNRIVDDAAFILASFSDPRSNDEEDALTRDFSFPTSSGERINVTLNDAPLSGTDHTDVGLQSWGASIVLSSMLCADPVRFGLTKDSLPENVSIIELGAGTGLVSLTMAKLFAVSGITKATISATDYHPAVLENCRTNVVTNFPTLDFKSPPVSVKMLDWTQLPENLGSTVDILIASDVIYAPEHAAWLRDCAAHLLKPSGTFWLMATTRKTGKFEGIQDTVESAFALDLCPNDDIGRIFKISKKERVDKRKGIGRADEDSYNLFKIAWDYTERK